MIYVFGATAIYTLFNQRKKLLQEKRNLVLYVILTVLGFFLGIVYLMFPYFPSLAMHMEKYMR